VAVVSVSEPFFPSLIPVSVSDSDTLAYTLDSDQVTTKLYERERERQRGKGESLRARRGAQESIKRGDYIRKKQK
jgi:hypothetical protein